MKFKLTSETIIHLGHTLYRIEAVISFGSVKSGDKGGFVETADNLSQVSGDAWVYGDAQVSGNARVSGNAWVYGDARVSPIHIAGLPYLVTITDAHMKIGCEYHLISEWAAFDDRRIAAMDGVKSAKFWAKHGPYLLALCADRPQATKIPEVAA